MKAYAIALFLIIFNIALSLISDIQIFTMLAADPAPPIYFSYDQQLLSDASGYLNTSAIGLEVIDILGLLGTLFSSLLNATIGLPIMLTNLGVPPIMNAIITIPTYYTYMAAVVQMTTGRIMPLFE
jgi:hypothetical protein